MCTTWTVLGAVFIVYVRTFAAGDNHIEVISSSYDAHSEVTFTSYKRSNGNSVSWQRAYNDCQRKGERLAVVSDSYMQTAVKNLTCPGNGCWIAGRRSNETWRWVNNSSFSGDVTGSSGKRCGSISADRLLASDCVRNSTEEIPGICQGYNSVEGQFMWTTKPFSSWFAARMECIKEDSELTHPSPGEDVGKWMTDITGTLIRENQSMVWIGLSRKQWSWVAAVGAGNGSLEDENYTTMLFYNFSDDAGDGSGRRCACVDLSRDGLWNDVRCNENLTHFVCDKGTHVPTLPPVTYPSDAPPSDSTEYSDTSATYWSPEEENQRSQKFPFAYVVGPIAAVMVGVIAATTIVLLRKRRMSQKSTQSSPSATDGAHNGLPIGSDSNRVSNNYEEIPEDRPSSGTENTFDHTTTAGASARHNYEEVVDFPPARGQEEDKSVTTSLPRDQDHVIGPHGDVYTIPSGTGSKKRLSESLTMMENAAYGDLGEAQN